LVDEAGWISQKLEEALVCPQGLCLVTSSPLEKRVTYFVAWQDCVLYYFPSPKGTKAKGMIILPSYNIWVAQEVKGKYAFKAVHVSART